MTSPARSRDRLGPPLRLSLAAAATTWVAMLSWGGFTERSADFLAVLVLVGLAVASIGALGRWRRVPGAVVLLGQAIGGSIVVCLFAGDRPYPSPAFWTAVDQAFEAARTYAAPVPSTAEVSVQPLLVIGGLAAMLLVDLLACTLRRVPLAGLPLLAVYSVPVSMLESGPAWWTFALTASGFLVLLFLQEQEHVGRWGRSLDPGTTSSRRSDAVRGSALLVAAVATAAAVLAPLAVPTVDLAVFDLGSGPGGDNQITIENPLTDMRRDLRRGDDIPLVEVVTDDPSPDHLRISVLNRFSDNEFSSGDRDVPAANLAEGSLPALQGVSNRVAQSATSFDYDVRIAPEFDSRWLPTQAPISAIDAPGDWRYDASTMDFLASEDDLSTAGLSYEMTALEYDFRSEDLRVPAAEVEPVSDEVTALPDSLPAIVGELARGVTAGQRTSYDRAVALQRWFREDGGFTYSLEDAPSAKVGTDELELFLREDTGRVGYCEQFATAMAVMARVLDIPSRVAVGFLTPDRTGPGTYVYSAHDLHAWPELYLPGAGWVLFDPTPSARVPDRELPAYTTRSTAVELPGEQPSAEPAPVPSERPAPPEPGLATDVPEVDDAAADDAGSAAGSWLRALTVLAVLALLVALALLPRTIRSRQRARRLAGGPESAWEELRAVTVDLGGSWPVDRSPRETAAVLVTRFGPPLSDHVELPGHGADQAPAAAAALDRLVLAVERSRYAPAAPAEVGTWGEDVEHCRAALEGGASPRERRRATWVPRSFVQRRPDPEVPSTAAGAARPDEGAGRTEQLADRV